MSKTGLYVIQRDEEKIYSMSNSFLPLDVFFNDIRDNKAENYDKERAYKDLEIIANFIIDLQSQLDQANERLNKKDEEFCRLSCDYKTLLSHYNVLNEKAIVPKFSSGQIVYFANIVEGTINKFNYMGEDKYNYVVEDKTGEVFIRMKERTFATEQEAQAKLQELRGGE